MTQSTAMIHDLSQVAIGLESVAGTLVAADTGLVVDEGIGAYQELIERDVRAAPRGVLAESEDIINRRQSDITYEQDLTFEEFPLALLCGLESVSSSGDDPYTHTFLPGLTAPEDLASATFEVAGTDGTTEHYKRRFGHAQVSEFSVRGTFGDAARHRVTWFGRAGQDLASPAAPPPLARELVQSELFRLYIDPTWDGLGTTLKSTLLRSFDLTVMTGVEPDFVLAGRADLDFQQIRRGRITGDLQLTAEFDGSAADEVAAWRAGTMRFARLVAQGTSGRSLAMDVAMKYVHSPTISEADGLVIVELTGLFRYDPVSTNVIGFEVINGIEDY